MFLLLLDIIHSKILKPPSPVKKKKKKHHLKIFAKSLFTIKVLRKLNDITFSTIQFSQFQFYTIIKWRFCTKQVHIIYFENGFPKEKTSFLLSPVLSGKSPSKAIHFHLDRTITKPLSPDITTVLVCIFSSILRHS